MQRRNDPMLGPTTPESRREPLAAATLSRPAPRGRLRLRFVTEMVPSEPGGRGADIERQGKAGLVGIVPLHGADHPLMHVDAAAEHLDRAFDMLHESEHRSEPQPERADDFQQRLGFCRLVDREMEMLVPCKMPLASSASIARPKERLISRNRLQIAGVVRKAARWAA